MSISDYFNEHAFYFGGKYSFYMYIDKSVRKTNDPSFTRMYIIDSFLISKTQCICLPFLNSSTCSGGSRIPQTGAKP